MRIKTARSIPAQPYLLERAKAILRETELLVDERGCWNWPRSLNMPGGYGRIMLKDRQRKNVGFLVHRLSWLIEYGTDPGEMFVCHTCDNRLCANPTHLFLGTEKDNFDDMYAKKRNPMGERNANSKLNAEKVIIIRGLLNAGMGTTEIAEAFGVCATTVKAIRVGKTWKHVA